MADGSNQGRWHRDGMAKISVQSIIGISLFFDFPRFGGSSSYYQVLEVIFLNIGDLKMVAFK